MDIKEIGYTRLKWLRICEQCNESWGFITGGGGGGGGSAADNFFAN
jgi:hypothetical protein